MLYLTKHLILAKINHKVLLFFGIIVFIMLFNQAQPDL